MQTTATKNLSEASPDHQRDGDDQSHKAQAQQDAQSNNHGEVGGGALRLQLYVKVKTVPEHLGQLWRHFIWLTLELPGS